MSSVSRNLLFLFISRGTRSFAAGFLAVIIGLYFLYSLHISTLLIGVLFAAGALATPVISLIVGRYGDIYGRKKVLMIDMLTMPAAIIIILLTKNYLLLMVATSLGGFGIAGGLVGGGVGASVGPVVSAMLAENTTMKNRTFLFSVNNQISTFAGAAGALIVAFLSYRQLFLLGLVFSFIAFISILPIKESYKPEPQKSGSSSNLSESDRKIIKIFAYTGIFNGLGQGFITPFLPIIFSEFFHLTNAKIGILVTVGGLISGLAFMFTPYFTNRVGFLKFITITRIISATLVIALPFSFSAIMAELLYILFTPLRAISLPAQSSLQMTLLSVKSRSTGSGINQAARLFPSALATIIGGAMLVGLPLATPFVIASGFTYANVYLYLRFFRGVKLANKPEREIGG
ncbi:MAG: MFS transporter [Nitrososphaerota archaeon]|nr:MFS transporter [Nitrososphaerota archaeon]MDG7045303.1 MFS transporter [Nitrososphaerota archaeon]